QADIEIRRNLVPAAGDPAGSIVPTGGVPAGSDPAGSILPTGGVLAGSSVPASDVPAASIPTCSVPTGGVLAGSLVSTAFGDPVASVFVLAVVPTDSAATSPLPPGHSLGSCAQTTRFPSLSDLGNHQHTAGIFSSSSYDDDFCADVTNLASNVVVDPIATKRVNTIHPQSQILRDLQSRVQTRSTMQKSQFGEKPSSVAKALADPDWVAAMQKEIQQTRGIPWELWLEIKPDWWLKAIGKRRALIMMRVVKALYGLHQAPRAWYARLSTFLLKHHYRRGTIDKTLFLKKDSRHIILVQVYVDDFIFGSTNKSWCDEFEVLMKGEFEMSAMGELMFFLRLQVKQLPDGIFISQDKYVKDILKKFDMESVRTATTPYEVPKHKSKDEPDDAVNVHLFRSMIGSFMYLTASRPDIMFAVSACSRHQVTPLTSHLNAVKKIFMYLKGQPNLGLWYPRDSPFRLEAYSDSDYAGSHDDRKSTTGGLSCGLLLYFVLNVSGYPKLQVVQLLVHADDLVPAGSCIIPTGKGWEAYEQILDFLNRSHIRYALTHRPTIVFESLVKQFWATATVRTLEAGPSDIISTINGNEFVVTVCEFTLRDVLDGMRAIRYPTDGSLTFYKAKLSPQ
nr:uncharacterized mitochondrial protein AtMg00810-like [Tanacetum cinerariifolium]